MMKTEKNKMSEKILNLTLEIICLLTGEDYTVLRKTSGKYVTPRSRNNGKKILDLTNKIIELLSGEVPIRCQDVAVYFSMEEWEYIEGHKDLYKDVMMEDLRNRTPPGKRDLYKDVMMEEHRNRTPSGKKDLYKDVMMEDHRNRTPPGKRDPCKDVMMEDHRNRTSPVGDEKKDHNEELNTSAPSLRDLREKDGEINGNVQDIERCPTGLEEYEPVRVAAEESNSRIMEEAAISTMTQYPSNNIEEKPLCDGENCTSSNFYVPVDRMMCGSSHFMECNEGNFSNPNFNTVVDKTPQYPSTPIKEEPVSHDEGNLIDGEYHTPMDHIQKHSTAHIQEEQALWDENLMDTNSYTPTDHTQYLLPNIKEEPVYCDQGNLKDPNIYKPRYNTEYPTTHFKEEPVSCDGVNHADLDIHANIDSSQQYPTTRSKNEPDSYDEGNVTNPGCTIPVDHTPQYPPKEEPALEEISKSQKPESSPLGKAEVKHVSKKLIEAEHNYNDITTSSKKYFCTIQQTTHSLEILYNCPECPESFPSNLDLAKHQIIHTGGMPFICSVCGKCFGRQSDLVLHQLTHEGSNYVRCSYCDISFPTKLSLSLHEKTHRKKPPPCLECGKTFPSKDRLKRHRQSHTNERPFKCLECGETYKRKAHLQRHQLGHEKSRQQLTSNGSGDFLRNELELSAQKPVQEKDKEFECSECGESLNDRLELFQHQVKHSRPNPFNLQYRRNFTIQR
ncbi:uncharacterized protein LOC142709515 [Rhinoderma darwinii]|uniref:uncharacterized protein LOC142709515 n=1 Tax=Rhinoderma darwinii TaxID=43563 RepID=UPI003F675BBA